MAYLEYKNEKEASLSCAVKIKSVDVGYYVMRLSQLLGTKYDSLAAPSCIVLRRCLHRTIQERAVPQSHLLPRIVPSQRK